MKWSIPTHVIDEGRELVSEQRVLTITPNIEQKTWQAVVMTDQLYDVVLDGTAKEMDSCTCDYFKKHQYCAHTVACELYLKEKDVSRIISKDVDYHEFYDEEKDEAICLEPLFELAMDDKKAVLPLVLAPSLYIEDGVLSVGLKVGVQHGRLYVVKDLYDFARAYFDGTVYKLGKNDVTILKEAFNESNQTLLDVIHSDLESAGQFQRMTSNRRRLIVSGAVFMTLVAQLDKENRLILNNKNVTITQAETPLPFILQLDQMDETLTVSFKEEDYIMIGENEWLVTAKHWWRLTPKESRCIQLMQRVFESNTPLHLTGTVKQRFMNELYPFLHDILTIQLSDALQHQLQYYPLEIIGKMSHHHQTLVMEPEYHYGPFIVHHNESPWLIRDLAKEEAFEKLLEFQGYHRQGHEWTKHMTSAKDWYHFFKTELAILQKDAIIQLSSALRQKYRMDALEPKIEVDETSRWLSVRFDISNISKQDIQPLIQSIQKHDTFYETSHGEIIDLTDESLSQTHDVLRHIRQTIQTDGSFHLPKYQALSFDDDSVQKTAAAQKLLENLKDSRQFHVTVPEALQATLRSYQYVGYQWLKMLSHYGLSGILADDMGLGKTLQVITYLLSEYKARDDFHALIVVPASVLYNWQAELHKFAPTMTTCIIQGTKERRIQRIEQYQTISITSYASFRQDHETYQRYDYDVLILDEAQMVKNNASKTFKALQQLEIPQRFALSGTPVENKREELWALFQLIMPGFLPSKARFKQLEPSFIAKMIQPFVLRRTKEEVLNDLLPREDIIYYSELLDAQKKMYLAYLEQMQTKVNAMDDATLRKNRLPILAGLTRLRQICCTPALFDERYHASSGKIEQLKTLLVQAKENHRRILLFSQFKTMLHVLEPILEELGLSYFMLTGDTSAKERQEQVDAFNEGKRDLFLISLKAGGVGLNLTGADTVILFDSWWNPAIEEQAAGRAHRIGQKKAVEVWHLIAEGTIEERIYELQQQKRDLFNKMLEAKEEDQLHQLSDEDLRYLLNFGKEDEE